MPQPPPLPLLCATQNATRHAKTGGKFDNGARTAMWPNDQLPEGLHYDVEYAIVKVKDLIGGTCAVELPGWGRDSLVTFKNPPRHGGICTEHALHSSVL